MELALRVPGVKMLLLTLEPSHRLIPVTLTRCKMKTCDVIGDFDDENLKFISTSSHLPKHGRIVRD